MRTLRPRPAAWLALAVGCVVAATVLQVLVLRAGGSLDLISPTALLGGILTGCGAVVLSRRPGHRVGRVLIGFGLLWAVDGLLESWYALGATAPYGGCPAPPSPTGSWPGSGPSC